MAFVFVHWLVLVLFFFTGRLGGNNRREKEATRKIKSELKYLREPDSGLRHRVFEISKGRFREVSSDT